MGGEEGEWVGWWEKCHYMQLSRDYYETKTIMWPSCDYCEAVMWLCDCHVTIMWPLFTTYPRTVLFSWQSMCVSVLCEWVKLWVVLWLCFPHLLSVEYIATSVTPPIENTTHIICRSGHECVNDNKVVRSSPVEGSPAFYVVVLKLQDGCQLH